MPAKSGPKPAVRASSPRAPADALAEAHKEHASHLVDLSRTCEQLRQRVGLLLVTEGIVLGAPVQGRVKAWTSVADKLRRSNGRRSSIFDLGDLVGIRVILLYRRDIERALELLRRELSLEREELKGMSEDDGFGYQSVHGMMTPASIAGASDAPRAPTGLACAEIQIRTLAQHIWAAASHDLQYKKEEGVPKPLRRTISRVSALLETVDLELDRVLEEREEYMSEAMIEPSRFALDVDILRKLLDRRLPGVNKDDDEPYSRCLDVLRGAGIETVADLDTLVRAHLDAVLRHERGILAALSSRKAANGSLRIAGYRPDRVERGAFYGHCDLVAKMLEHERARTRPSKR